MQWVWSKTKYLEDIIKQWKEVVDGDQAELNNLEEQLLKLKKPFGHLENTSDWNLVREERSFSAKGTGLEPGFITNIDGFAEKQVFRHFDHGVVKRIVVAMYVVWSVFVMFGRPDFVNVRGN